MIPIRHGQRSQKRRWIGKWYATLAVPCAPQLRSEYFAVFLALIAGKVPTETISQARQCRAVYIGRDTIQILIQVFDVALDFRYFESFNGTLRLSRYTGFKLHRPKRIGTPCLRCRSRGWIGLPGPGPNAHPLTDDALVPFVVRIGLPDQVGRLGASCRLDSEKMNPDSEGLRNLNPDPDVFFSRQDQRIANCPVPRQFDEIGNDQGIHTLLLSMTIHHPETELGVGSAGNLILFGRGHVGSEKPVVPIYSKETAPRGYPVGLLNQLFQDFLYGEPQRGARLLLACKQRRALGIQIPCIDEDRDL